MKKILLLWGCLLMTFSAVADQPGADEGLNPDQLWVEGYVVELEYNKRLLTVSGQQFHVPVDAQVSNGFGGSNSFSLLQPGQAVRVIYREDKSGRIAYEIRELAQGQTPEQF